MDVIEIKEVEYWGDDFKDPPRCAYFIINMFGDVLYFKTTSRKKAQDYVDNLYGKGLFSVRKVMKAAVR